MPEQWEYGGPISSNSEVNPDFYDWNHAFFPYCDGASFSGDRDKPVMFRERLLFFRGHRVMLSIINDLLKNKGLDKATDVLVAGDSAGAIATFLHVDEIKSLMPDSVKRFKAVPLSGIFLDYVNVDGEYLFGAALKKLFELQNCSGGLNKKCVEAMAPEDQYKCMFAEHTLPFIETPIMPVGSVYDSIGTSCVIGSEPETGGPTQVGAGNCSAAPGWAQCEADPSKCTAEQWEKIEDYANQFVKVIENNTKFKEDGNGLFEYNCHTHDIEGSDSNWITFSTNGVTIREAVKNWYFSDNEPTSSHFHKDCLNHGNYSCNPICEGH